MISRVSFIFFFFNFWPPKKHIKLKCEYCTRSVILKALEKQIFYFKQQQPNNINLQTFYKQPNKIEFMFLMAKI